MTSIAVHGATPRLRSADGRYAPTRRPSTASPKSRLRITARGRVVLALVVLTPIVAAAIAMSSSPASASSASESGASESGAQSIAADFTYVTVDAGESLWSVAERIAPAADPREVITEIQLLNGLDDSAVAAGQSLAIPARYTH